MSVKALYDYDFPSADRAELFGDDQLVYVQFAGNPMFCSAAAFRAPRDMSFSDFVRAMVKPWASSDPEFDHSAMGDWKLFGELLEVDFGKSLTEHGIGHKALLSFSAR